MQAGSFTTILSVHGADIFCFVAATGLYWLYHLWIHAKTKRHPQYTIQGVTTIARTAWVRHVMARGDSMLAVQTLRNSTMAATFLASTAILLAVGVLSLVNEAGGLTQTWLKLSRLGATEHSLFPIKLLVLLVNLFVAFFCFSSSIRLFNHVGFLINVPARPDNEHTATDYAVMELDRAARHFRNGMRAYYFLVPLIFWLFGPALLLGSSLLMIGVVFMLDRAAQPPATSSGEASDASQNE